MLENFFNNFAKNGCIVNGSFFDLKEIQEMGYTEFSFRSKINTPLKLYKYFSNTEKQIEGKTINYSLDALKNNTVHMASPTEFDDVYDSDVNVDWAEYERGLLLYYCDACKIQHNDNDSTDILGTALVQKFYDVYTTHKNFNTLFDCYEPNTIDRLNLENFCLNVQIELNKVFDLGQAVGNILCNEYQQYVKNLKTGFRVACFATTPFSQLMWGGSYADMHKGFCIEYTIDQTNPELNDIYYNLYPMIYSKARSYYPAELISEDIRGVTKEVLWGRYFHGALRKSVDWAFQNEWRLLLPDGWGRGSNYNIPFFPISKVFLGNRMPFEKRKQIIDICHEKKIQYSGITKSPRFFEMTECAVPCEKCPQYLHNN